jgi:hypothetical protein
LRCSIELGDCPHVVVLVETETEMLGGGARAELRHRGAQFDLGRHTHGVALIIRVPAGGFGEGRSSGVQALRGHEGCRHALAART